MTRVLRKQNWSRTPRIRFKVDRTTTHDAKTKTKAVVKDCIPPHEFVQKMHVWPFTSLSRDAIYSFLLRFPAFPHSLYSQNQQLLPHFHFKQNPCLHNFVVSLQVSFAATSPALSNRENFPTFCRLAAADSSHNAARKTFIQHFDWNTVATIHEDLETFSLVSFLCVVLPLYFILCPFRLPAEFCMSGMYSTFGGKTRKHSIEAKQFVYFWFWAGLSQKECHLSVCIFPNLATSSNPLIMKQICIF